jgi:hypothetical protein
MGGGDKVDIMASHFLKSLHGPGHIRKSDTVTPSFVADVIILAEEAAEATMGEKDCP